MLLRLAAQLLWPARCAACNVFVPEGWAFCESCALSLSPVESACQGCGLPHINDGRGGSRRC
ncbi:MAG TPA: double zinc ribbon domain-containing protein, partial [Polyangia bacterium]|nr:double zinc ribbon domain-containing protein [Polyangia bacterium]